MRQSAIGTSSLNFSWGLPAKIRRNPTSKGKGTTNNSSHPPLFFPVTQRRRGRKERASRVRCHLISPHTAERGTQFGSPLASDLIRGLGLPSWASLPLTQGKHTQVGRPESQVTGARKRAPSPECQSSGAGNRIRPQISRARPIQVRGWTPHIVAGPRFHAVTVCCVFRSPENSAVVRS